MVSRKKKKKRKGGSAKGSSFEREICKRLSLWWSKNKRDDIFWRTSGSGARATIRSKSKQKTFGQYGDVQATDPIGQPLLDVFTIEIKRGYSKDTFANLVEQHENPKAKPSLYETFIEQAIKSYKQSGSLSWMVIAKRDRRKPIVIISHLYYNLLGGIGKKIVPKLVLKFKFKKKKSKGKITIFITTLDIFLKEIKQKDVKRMLRNQNQK